MKKHLLLLSALLSAAQLAPLSAHAQEWPAQAVRVVVPFTAGSTPDVLARIVTERLRAQLGQPFVIENKGGAGGIIGTELVAKSRPDGYTLGVGSVGPLAMNAVLFKKMPYDPKKDLTPIGLIGMQPSLLVVKAGEPNATLAAWIERLRREPDRYSYGSIGNGSLSHLAMAVLNKHAGSRMAHVPYPGSSQLITALIAGDVQMATLPALVVMPQSKAGRLAAIAVTTEKRWPMFPEIPTFTEHGLNDIVSFAWFGFFGPAGMPDPLVRRIHQALTEAISDKSVQDALRSKYFEPAPMTPAQFSALLDSEVRQWTPVIVENGISLD